VACIVPTISCCWYCWYEEDKNNL